MHKNVAKNYMKYKKSWLYFVRVYKKMDIINKKLLILEKNIDILYNIY